MNRIDSIPPRRPTPLPLPDQPPKGVRPSQYAADSFTFTTPHSSLSAQRNAVFMSDVYTDAHRPRAQLFATAMASSTSRTTMTGAMGPKGSSRFASEGRLTWSTTAGGQSKLDGGAPPALPANST